MLKRFITVLAATAVIVLSPLLLKAQVPGPTMESGTGSHHDTSPALTHIRPSPRQSRPPHEIPLRHHHKPKPPSRDPVVQQSVSIAVGITPGLGFDGVGIGNYAVNAAPPDPNGAPGAKVTLPDGRVIDQYVQWVNEDVAVFDKGTGGILYGPVPGNTLWSGFGGPCESNNDGDPIVQYDASANRWVLAQFAVTGGPPYYYCVAVSTSPDATGSYSRYAFQYLNFNDYAKLGVWPDAYYSSFNMFQGDTFIGSRVCAYDRNAMLTGSSATQQCFQLSSAYGGLLPSDLDGPALPPAGSPNFFLALDSNALQIWKFHVDWANPSLSTLTGPSTIPVAAFAEACNGGICIPQTGTSQKLDSLGDRLMYRLTYRHFPDGHEALVANHSVNPGGNTAGVRWYELRNPGGSTMASGSPVLYQQGTYAPDSTYRWMGSLAMDQVGNIAVGYSVSSSAIHPGIRYTGRAPTDPLGLLGVEMSIIEGTGSQTRTLNRWGDYTSMRIDPTDDCTFWYTNEYLKSNGTFNWSTRIASFKFTTCTQIPTLTVNGSSAPITVAAGSTVTLGVQNGPGTPSDCVSIFLAVSGDWWGYAFVKVSTATVPFFFGSAGTYEFHFWQNCTTLLATSPTVTVQGSLIPRLTVNGSSAPITVTGGTTVSVGVQNGPGNQWDCVSLNVAGSPDWLKFAFLNGNTTVPFTIPSTLGTYEFRFWQQCNTLLATSPTVTVQNP